MNGHSALKIDGPAPVSTIPSAPELSTSSMANVMQQQFAYQQQQLQQQMQQQMQVHQAQQAHQALQAQHAQLTQQAERLQNQEHNHLVPGSTKSRTEQDATLNGGQSNHDDEGDPNSSVPNHPIAEFLYQLTKMLSDNNEEIVEWTNGRIKVHYPDRLEGEVLHKYFRHSKFASFQRQLNYFGFRKIAGKGKMSPCSYVNDGATADIRSLLMIKRKTNGSAARKAAMVQAQQQQRHTHQTGQTNMMAPPAGMMMQTAPTAGMTADLFKNAFAAAGMSTQQMQVLQGMGFPSPGTMFISNNTAYAQVAAMQAQQQNVAAQQAANLQQRQLNESLFYPNDSALATFSHGQRKHSMENMASMAPGAMPSTGSLDAMSSFGSFGAFAQRQSALNLAALFSSPLNYGAPYAPQPSSNVGAATAALNGLVSNAPNHGTPAPLNHPTATGAASARFEATSSTPVSAAFQSTTPTALAASSQSVAGAATAALAATMPSGAATAALGAAGPASATAAMREATSQANSIFENNANLNALLGKDEEKGSTPGPAPGNTLNRFSSSNLLRLPSSGAFFPDSFSSVSLSGLMPGMSSNRLNSMLSLSSFFSRDPSMGDFTGNGSNYASTQYNALSAVPPLSALTSGAPLSVASLAALRGAAAFPSVYPSGNPGLASGTGGTAGVAFEPMQMQDNR